MKQLDQNLWQNRNLEKFAKHEIHFYLKDIWQSMKIWTLLLMLSQRWGGGGKQSPEPVQTMGSKDTATKLSWNPKGLYLQNKSEPE